MLPASEAHVAGVDAEEVALSGGRVARLLAPDPARDRRIDLLVRQAGYDHRGTNWLQHALWRTLLSIDTIDGEPFGWPPPRQHVMNERRRLFTDDDLTALAHAYDRRNPTLAPPQGPPKGW